MEKLQHSLDELSSILDMVRWGASQLNYHQCYFGHGFENAWDEALHLVLYAIHLLPEISPTQASARLTHSEREKIFGLFKWRIEERIPSAYITHTAYFAGLPFYVDERVLIPRSPIAELIAAQFEPLITQSPEHILDLCTGSGCIAIACAKAFPEATVDAVDLSKDALFIAKQNVERLDEDGQVTLYEGDCFEPLPSKPYDLIVTNPPYVDAADMDSMPAEYHHEPRMGLTAGDDGLSVVRNILAHAKDYLSPTGVLVCEVGNSAEHVLEAFPTLPMMWLAFEHGGHGVFVVNASDL